MGCSSVSWGRLSSLPGQARKPAPRHSGESLTKAPAHQVGGPALLAEREGFEPSRAFALRALQARALDRTMRPLRERLWRRGRDLNPRGRLTLRVFETSARGQTMRPLPIVFNFSTVVFSLKIARISGETQKPASSHWLRWRPDSVLWWMPTRQHPIAAHFLCIRIVAQAQCGDRRPPDRCQPDDAQTIFTPAKVFGPDLSAGIEKWNRLSCLRYEAGDDVLNFQAGHDQVLWAEAIAAAVPGRRTDTAFDLGRDVMAGHGYQLRGGLKPRSTATFRACAFRTRPRR